MKSFISLIVVAAIYAANTMADDADLSSGTRPCPGGHAHASQFEVGNYWYECQNGQVVPKGCLSEEKRRIDVGGTYDNKQYRMQCTKDQDGFLTVIYVACIYEGSEHDVGSQWNDGTAFYTCVKDGNNVRVHTLGCVDQGRPMKFDERVAKGDFIYQCRKSTDGTSTLNKVGCVSQGRKYNIGETFDGPKFWYTCTDHGAEIVGCMYESHRLQNGDRFTKDDIMYSCQVTGEGTNYVAYACLQREESGASIERKVGCSWVEGDHEYTCKEDGSNKASKVQTQCVYHAQKGVLKVQPGCVRLAANVAVGCLQDTSSGTLKLETYSADQIDSLPGLRQC